jgi:hypothetical protein
VKIKAGMAIVIIRGGTETATTKGGMETRTTIKGGMGIVITKASATTPIKASRDDDHSQFL